MPTRQAPSREDHDNVFRLMMAGWGAQVIRTLAMFSVAELLESGPLTAHQIAERLSSDPAMTFRILRAGAALGFLNFDPDAKQFSGTTMLAVLHDESPLSLKHCAQTVPSAVHWLPSLQLPETVLRGQNFASEALGCTPFEHFAKNPREARQFSASMTELSTPVITEAVSKMDIGDARLVVDVGGADGAFVATLLERHAQLTGVVLDLPQAIPGVSEEANRRGLVDRMTGTVGDFFTEVPAADLYLLKFILHDWDDDSCVRLLSNVRRAMNPGARLIIVEMNADQYTLDAALMDLVMLFAYKGQERDEAHFDSLAKNAGLKTSRVQQLHRPYVLIETVAA